MHILESFFHNRLDGEVHINWGRVRRRAPDSGGGFHHQKDVHGVNECPPKRGAEEQLDPHLQHIHTVHWGDCAPIGSCSVTGHSVTYVSQPARTRSSFVRAWLLVIWDKCLPHEIRTFLWRIKLWKNCHQFLALTSRFYPVGDKHIPSCWHRRPLATYQCCWPMRCSRWRLAGPPR